MTYKTEFSKRALKQFEKLPSNIQERIQLKIDELTIEPRPNGVKKLQGDETSYRIRVGDYRVVYDIFDDVLMINIIKVGHRSKIYKNEI